jgi:hypothetical protein
MSKSSPMDEWDQHKWARSLEKHTKRLIEDDEYRHNFVKAQEAVQQSRIASMKLIDARRSLAPFEAALQIANNEVLELVSETYGIPKYAVHLGGWECKDSPTGHCIYDDRKDNSHDYCIVCGDPSERK